MPQLTEDQLDFFSQQTERAARKAVRRYRRSAVVGFAVLALGIGAQQYTTNHDANSSRQAIVVTTRDVATASCNGRFLDRQVLREIVEAQRPVIAGYVKDGTLTLGQGTQAIKQLNETLTLLRLPDCRRAAEIITDDPTHAAPNTPPALYPGAPAAGGFTYKAIG
jgi:hypothetical protein